MNDKGMIIPWDIGGLEDVLTDSASGRRVSREEFVSEYGGYDFLYGRGVSPDAKSNGYHTVPGGLNLCSGDSSSIVVFAVPPLDQISIEGIFKDRIGVGRVYDPNVQIVIPDPSVSKLQAYLKKISGGLAVADADSRNGTWVNKRRVGGLQVLSQHDKIRFGKANIIFEYLLSPLCYDAALQDIERKK